MGGNRAKARLSKVVPVESVQEAAPKDPSAAEQERRKIEELEKRVRSLVDEKEMSKSSMGGAGCASGHLHSCARRVQRDLFGSPEALRPTTTEDSFASSSASTCGPSSGPVPARGRGNGLKARKLAATIAYLNHATKELREENSQCRSSSGVGSSR